METNEEKDVQQTQEVEEEKSPETEEFQETVEETEEVEPSVEEKLQQEVSQLNCEYSKKKCKRKTGCSEVS